MNFSNNKKLSKILSLIAVMLLLVSMFAGCQKGDDTADTTESPSFDINLADDTEPSETEPTETTPVIINENMATVISQLNVRLTPSTEATLIGTLDAGEQVEILSTGTVLGVEWALIECDSLANSGWVCTDFLERNVPSDEPINGTTTPPATGPAATEPSNKTSTPNETTTTQNIKGVITASELYISSESTKDSDIAGSYLKGDVVTILETKNGWGRTSKGWIKMEFVNTGNTTTNNSTDNTKEEDNTTANTGNGNTTVVSKGIVTASELNVRSSASTNGDKVGSLKYGARVEILEKDGTWGRTKDGWINLDFVYQDGTTGTNTSKGVVTGTQLYIRSGPGTGYDAVGSYNAGDRVSILEQFTYNGTKWGCTSKGWISMDYIYVDGTDIGETESGTVNTDGLRVRGGPGTGYEVVGSLNEGDTVKIFYQLKVGDTTCG